MKKYYVNNNAQNNGDHEVHKEECYWLLPLSKNRSYLGEFSNCKDAVNKTKIYHSQVNGCKHCSENCHTS